MKELNRLLQQLADNISEARKNNEINDDLEGAESDIAEVQALVKNLFISIVSKRLKDYANWIGKNEFTMFADGNWRDGFGNEFTNSELHNLYLNKPNK